MQTLFYQLTANEFRIQQDDQVIQQGMGLSHIAAQIKTQTLNPLSIEQAIYSIEEVLEQFHLPYHTPRIAMSHDVELQQLSTLFFNQDTVISREMMEHAFNEWTARQIYTEDSVLILQLGLYFIFIREMMHHLNVT